MLPSLQKPDGLMTTSQLQSAQILLETQIEADDPSTDGPLHCAERRLAEAPYVAGTSDKPFTMSERPCGAFASAPL